MDNSTFATLRYRPTGTVKRYERQGRMIVRSCEALEFNPVLLSENLIGKIFYVQKMSKERMQRALFVYRLVQALHTR